MLNAYYAEYVQVSALAVSLLQFPL